MFRSNAIVNYKGLWRTRLKRLGIAAVILAGVLVAFLIVEKIRGSTGLNRRLAQLKQSGEKLSVADFEPNRAKPEEDAADALLALSNRLESVSSLWKVTPPAGRFAQPGQMIRVSTIKSWSYEKKTNTWNDATMFLAEDKSLSADLHVALLRQGWNDGFNYQNGFIDFQMAPLGLLKNLSQRLALVALIELRQNDIGSAVERIEDAGRLLRHQANSSLIINQLVRIAEAAIVWNATWEVITSGKCSESHLARLQAAWEGLDFNIDMSRSMQMERNMTLVNYDLIVGSAMKGRRAMEELTEAAEFGLGPRPPTKGFVLTQIHLPVWRFSWARQDELRSLNRWQEVIDFDREARSKSWCGVSDRVTSLDDETGILAAALADEDGPKMNLYDRMRYLFSGMTFSIGSNTTRKSVQIETQRRMMIAAIAIERWKLRHGKYPKSLEELTPELLAAVPVDLMNNQPLHYKLAVGGSAFVYSVGEDGRDDDGDVQPSDAKTTYRKIWDGKDAVWPQPASAQDAEKAAHQR